MRIQRRTLLAAGLTGMAWTATQGLAAASSTRTRFVFHVSSTWGNLLDWLVDRGYAPITAELEKRGFPSMLMHSSVRGSDMPNEDRALAIVKALQNVTDHVVIVGISNQGNFLPLVAAARPIRRVVESQRPDSSILAVGLILPHLTGKKHPKLPRFSTLFKGLARDPKIPSCIY